MSLQGNWIKSKPTCKNKKNRGLYPVSVNFGRPDIERYISETVQGTGVTAEWAADSVGGAWCPKQQRHEVPPTKLRQVQTPKYVPEHHHY